MGEKEHPPSHRPAFAEGLRGSVWWGEAGQEDGLSALIVPFPVSLCDTLSGEVDDEGVSGAAAPALIRALVSLRVSLGEVLMLSKLVAHRLIPAGQIGTEDTGRIQGVPKSPGGKPEVEATRDREGISTEEQGEGGGGGKGRTGNCWRIQRGVEVTKRKGKRGRQGRKARGDGRGPREFVPEEAEAWQSS